MKHVHSRDPRKPAIIAAMRRKLGIKVRITELKEGPGHFVGNALKYIPSTTGHRIGFYEALGEVMVTEADLV